MENTQPMDQFQQWSSYRRKLSLAHKRQQQRRALMVLSVFALLLAAAVSLLVYRLTAMEAQLSQLRAEQEQLCAAMDQTGAVESELRARVEELVQDNEVLQQRVAETEQELQQALADKLAALAEARKRTPSPYSDLYPELYAAPADLQSQTAEHTVYLTFDDGPSERTGEILDILRENGVKATFFVTGQTSQLAQDMMRRIVEEGHTIGIHTYTHDYRKVYASVPAFLEDFDRIYNWVHQVTGVYPQIFRFPGGSINDYNRKIYKKLIAEMERRGFIYYDWNAANGDALGVHYTVAELTQNALSKVGFDRLIVLMHDSADKTGTVACLPEVIAGYRDAGYEFAPLTPEVKAITFE